MEDDGTGTSNRGRTRTTTTTATYTSSTSPSWSSSLTEFPPPSKASSDPPAVLGSGGEGGRVNPGGKGPAKNLPEDEVNSDDNECAGENDNGSYYNDDETTNHQNGREQESTNCCHKDVPRESKRQARRRNRRIANQEQQAGRQTRKEKKRQRRNEDRSSGSHQGDNANDKADREGGGGFLPNAVPRVIPLELDGAPVFLVGGTDVDVDVDKDRCGTVNAPPRNAVPQHWIRVVDPYPHTYSSYAKGRWVGRTLHDVYSTEFGSYPESYYREAIRQGRITVNEQVVTPDYIVQRTDLLRHAVHRHEPAVHVHSPIPPHVTIVDETDECLVIDKPGSLPIHPCGGYHLNSLMPLLQQQQKRRHLYTVHRLDRLTSGLVVLAKDPSVAADWANAIQARECQKLYLARVKGEFPLALVGPQLWSRTTTEIPRLDPPDFPIHGEWPVGEGGSGDGRARTVRERHAHGWWITNAADCARPDSMLEECTASTASDAPGRSVDDWIVALAGQGGGDNHSGDCDPDSGMRWLHLACPTRVVEPKNGVCDAGTFSDLVDDDAYRATVKAAHTSFAALRYDTSTDTTLVLCRPQTGRTHQIRVHLWHIGHPIANDPNYGGTLWYGDPRGQAACRRAQELLDSGITTVGGDGVSAEGPQPANNQVSSSGRVTSDEPATEAEVQRCVVGLPPRVGDEPLDDFLRRTCVWCARNQAGRADRASLELLVRSPRIWLHALQYSVVRNHQRIVFRTKLPDWSAM